MSTDSAVSFADLLVRWRAAPVVDIHAHPEADVFLVDEEWGYQYRLMTVTAADFPPFPGAGADEDDLHRSDLVRAWMEAEGGSLPATTTMPVLAIIHADRVELVDGWHRLTVGGTVWAYVGKWCGDVYPLHADRPPPNAPAGPAAAAGDR